MKKILKVLTVMSMFLLTQWNLQAQQPFPGPPHRGPVLERFSEQLGLSDEQQAELKKLHETHRAEAKALMDQEFDSPEARRAAMKALMDRQREALEGILTAAQLEKLAALKQEAQARREADRAANVEKHQAMREEVGAYQEKNITPVLKAQRLKLEAQLSAEDKATIAELRAKRAAHRQDLKALTPGERRERPRLTDEQKAVMKADREKIQALVEKYDGQITSLLDGIKDQRETWKNDLQEIGKKYAPEPPEDRPAPRDPNRIRGKRMDGARRAEKPAKGMAPRHPGMPMRKEGMGKAGFLLLDPKAESTPAAAPKTDFAELRVFPNPSNSRNTVNYQLKEAGHYRVELRDKDGKVLQVISNEYREAGDYREEVDLSAYPAGTYYVSIVGAEGVVSKKVVIAK